MKDITITTKSNYLAKVVELKGLQKHPGADRLQVVSIDFQNVITGPDAKDGDICVFFPLECTINKKFLSETNSYRHKEMNVNTLEAGFFEDNGRVKAMKLRGEKSMGYVVPVEKVEEFAGIKISQYVGEEFDTVNGIILCEKYVVYTRQSGENKLKGKKPRISRIVDGQVHLHVDTEQLRKNAFKISPEDEISVSYKVHGTSWWVSNVLGKKKLNIFEKCLRAIGINIQQTEYDHFYGSRKVVKNEYETQFTNDFYDGDLWGDIKEEVKDKVPVGFTLYGEAIGYTKGGKAIQSHYDYGCTQGEHKLQVYRITFTNADGLVIDLSTTQMQQFCDRSGLTFVHVYFKGKAKEMWPELSVEDHWHEEWLKKLESAYTEKDCFMCKNIVPEEGIVIKKESMFGFESYKLKSFRFLQLETELLDEGVLDIESI